MNPMEQPAPSEQKKSGLEKKVAEYQVELTGVETKLAEIERLEKIRSGLGPVREALDGLEDCELAIIKTEELDVVLRAQVGNRNPESVLARRRELKQLIEQAKIDSAD